MSFTVDKIFPLADTPTALVPTSFEGFEQISLLSSNRKLQCSYTPDFKYLLIKLDGKFYNKENVLLSFTYRGHRHTVVLYENEIPQDGFIPFDKVASKVFYNMPEAPVEFSMPSSFNDYKNLRFFTIKPYGVPSPDGKFLYVKNPHTGYVRIDFSYQDKSYVCYLPINDDGFYSFEDIDQMKQHVYSYYDADKDATIELSKEEPIEDAMEEFTHSKYTEITVWHEKKILPYEAKNDHPLLAA